MKKTTWLGILFVALVLGYIVISSFRPKFRCQVCIVFNGSRDCRTASAETQENALRTAIANACAQLAGSKVENNQCEAAAPESITWLK